MCSFKLWVFSQKFPHELHFYVYIIPNCIVMVISILLFQTLHLLTKVSTRIAFWCKRCFLFCSVKLCVLLCKLQFNANFIAICAVMEYSGQISQRQWRETSCLCPTGENGRPKSVSRWGGILFSSLFYHLIICLDDQPVWYPLQLASVKSQGLVSPICPWQCEKIYLSCSFL